MYLLACSDCKYSALHAIQLLYPLFCVEHGSLRHSGWYGRIRDSGSLPNRHGRGYTEFGIDLAFVVWDSK